VQTRVLRVSDIPDANSTERCGNLLVGSMLLQYDFSQVFIWVINPVPDALHVDERDRAVFRTNADLFDSKPGATVNDCLT
jgi:hypothetical protein